MNRPFLIRELPEADRPTKRLTDTGEILGIELLDHIIIGYSRWTSLKDKGLF